MEEAPSYGRSTQSMPLLFVLGEWTDTAREKPAAASDDHPWIALVKTPRLWSVAAPSAING